MEKLHTAEFLFIKIDLFKRKDVYPIESYAYYNIQFGCQTTLSCIICDFVIKDVCEKASVFDQPIGWHNVHGCQLLLFDILSPFALAHD